MEEPSRRMQHRKLHLCVKTRHWIWSGTKRNLLIEVFFKSG